MVRLTLMITACRINFLSEALLSIVAQSVTEFELLCVVDSTGESRVQNCFEEWQSYFSVPTRILCVDGNGTAGRVRNEGIAAAHGNWIIYLDGDDFLHPRAMEVMLEAIRNCNPDIRLLSSGMVRVSGDGVPSKIAESLLYRPPAWIYQMDPDLVGHPTYFNQLQAIRKSAWSEYPYDDTTNGEDIDFVLHHLLLGGFQKVPEYLYFFRQTPGSFSTRIFEGGDICTQRYRSGYYANLHHRLYGPHVAANFIECSMPEENA